MSRLIVEKEDVENDIRSTELPDLIFLLRTILLRSNSDWQFLQTAIEEELARRGRLIRFGKESP